MFAALALTVLAVSPAKGSRWQWDVSDTRTASGRVVYNERTKSFVSTPPVRLKLEVTEPGQKAPARLKVEATEGLGIKGLQFDVENSYGEAIFTRRGQVSAGEREDDAFADQKRRLRVLLGLLTKPDPVVDAAGSDGPCSGEALDAVAEGTAMLARVQLSPGTGEEYAYVSGSASCLGKGPARKYGVRFTLRTPNGATDTDYPFAGTVEVPKGAWRSSYQLKASFEHVTELGAKTLKLRGTVTLKSRMTKR